MEITSRENETFKNLLKLTDKKHRRRTGLCIIEGEKIVKDNLGRVEQVFIRRRKTFENAIVLDDKLFDEVSSLENDTGVLASIKIPLPREITYPYLVLDSIQDSGNIGTILRTAAAFGFGTVICVNCVDVWSQKVLRASSGVAFLLNIIECSLADFVKPSGSKLVGADLSGESMHVFSNNAKFGLVLGNEGRGISDEIKKLIDVFVTIPMKDFVESLNVAVAGGILMYELTRGM